MPWGPAPVNSMGDLDDSIPSHGQCFIAVTLLGNPPPGPPALDPSCLAPPEQMLHLPL